MCTDRKKLIPFSLKVLCASLLFSSVWSGSVFAHGKEKHPEKGGMNQHMQAMMAVKEKVPENYRIMEQTPIIPNEASLTQGKELYNRNCAVCHGENGDGQGPAAAALQTAPADFLNVQHSGMYNPGEKFWIIGNGTGTTGMPPFKNLNPAERWHLVNFIISLQTEKADHAAPAMKHHD